MSRSARCPQCGLTQLAAPRCKLCGGPLPGEHPAASSPPPTLPGPPATTPLPTDMPVLRKGNWIRRILGGIGWYIVFYCGGHLLVATVAGAIAGMNNPGRAAIAGALAGRAAVASLRAYITVGATALAIWGAWRRWLPGTRTTIARPAEARSSETPASKLLPLRAGRALVIVGVFFVVQILVGFLFGVGAGAYHSFHARPGSASIPTNLGARLIISSAITGLLLAGLVAFRMVWRSLPDSSGTRSLASIGCSIGSRRHILIALLAGLLVAAFYFLILMQHFPPRPDHVWGPLARAAASPGWSQHAWAILVLLLAPPIEEFFFRGILFAGLCRSWGQIVAAGCVTLLFIGGHATEILTYWPAIVAIGLLALGTMTARMTANSLGPAMAMHAAYNLGVVIWVYSATV